MTDAPVVDPERDADGFVSGRYPRSGVLCRHSPADGPARIRVVARLWKFHCGCGVTVFGLSSRDGLGSVFGKGEGGIRTVAEGGDRCEDGGVEDSAVIVEADNVDVDDPGCLARFDDETRQGQDVGAVVHEFGWRALEEFDWIHCEGERDAREEDVA